jgi:hypothetical protein
VGVEESERLISWLRTVVYWGTPTDRATGEFKDPGYNSVWFDKEGDVFKLFMSGKLVEGKPVGISQFTPSELINKRGEIISLLGEMYTNTNSFKVQSGWEMPYEQITDVTADGVIESVRWPNYQSYLLSSKAPNKEGKLTIERKGEDIPLTTSIRPLRDENDTNRNGVYFIINDRANDDRFSSIVPTPAQPKTLTPGAPKPAPQPTAPSVTPTPPAKPVGKFVLDGKTVNSLPMTKPAKATLKFTYNENVPDEVNDLEIIPEKGETVQLTDALITALNLVDKVEGDVTVTAQEQAINLVVNHVLKEVNKEIAASEEFEKQQAAAQAEAAQPAPVVTPTETAPVSTDAKAEIERRRQEDNKSPVRQSVKYKLQNKIGGIDNPTQGNEIPTLSEALKIAGSKISNPIKIKEGEITHIVFDQEESTFRFTYKGTKFAAFYIANARGNVRWEIAKFNEKSGTYQSISLDELKNINEKYGSQKDLLLSLGAKDLVEDIENFENVEYSKEDKSSGNGIIPLENTVSAEQVRLGKKYGVTYTLEDFLKEYDAELNALKGGVKADVNSLIDKRTVENELTNGRYSFYPTQEAAEQDKGVVITKDNVNQAIEAEKKLGDVIYNNKSNQIAGIPTPVIQVEISSGTSIEFANAKDLQDFINNPK